MDQLSTHPHPTLVFFESHVSREDQATAMLLALVGNITTPGPFEVRRDMINNQKVPGFVRQIEAMAFDNERAEQEFFDRFTNFLSVALEATYWEFRISILFSSRIGDIYLDFLRRQDKKIFEGFKEAFLRIMEKSMSQHAEKNLKKLQKKYYSWKRHRDINKVLEGLAACGGSLVRFIDQDDCGSDYGVFGPMDLEENTSGFVWKSDLEDFEKLLIQALKVVQKQSDLDSRFESLLNSSHNSQHDCRDTQTILSQIQRAARSLQSAFLRITEVGSIQILANQAAKHVLDSAQPFLQQIQFFSEVVKQEADQYLRTQSTYVPTVHVLCPAKEILESHISSVFVEFQTQAAQIFEGVRSRHAHRDCGAFMSLAIQCCRIRESLDTPFDTECFFTTILDRFSSHMVGAASVEQANFYIDFLNSIQPLIEMHGSDAHLERHVELKVYANLAYAYAQQNATKEAEEKTEQSLVALMPEHSKLAGKTVIKRMHY